MSDENNKELLQVIEAAKPKQALSGLSSLAGTGNVIPMVRGRVDGLLVESSEDAAALHKLNETFSMVRMGAKIVVAFRAADGRMAFIFEATFSRIVNNQYPRLACGKKPGDAWLGWSEANMYLDGPVFRPNDDHSSKELNIYQGFLLEQPIDAEYNPEPFKRHIEYMCDGDPTCIEYLTKWLAHIIQKPGERCNVAVIATGEAEGTGKGSLLQTMEQILGFMAVGVSSGDVVGRFNSAIEGKLFTLIDEAKVFGGGVERIKRVVTEPRLMVERKGVDGQLIDNYTRLLLASNEDNPLPMSAKSRRWFVIKSPELNMESERYEYGGTQFGIEVTKERFPAGANLGVLLAYYRDTDKGRSPYRYLMEQDISDFDTQRSPCTQGLKEQRHMSIKAGSFEDYVHRELEKPNPFMTGGNSAPSKLYSKEICTAFESWSSAWNHDHDLAGTSLSMTVAKWMKILGCEKFEENTKSSGGFARGYKFPSLEIMRGNLDRHYSG